MKSVPSDDVDVTSDKGARALEYEVEDQAACIGPLGIIEPMAGIAAAPRMAQAFDQHFAQQHWSVPQVIALTIAATLAFGYPVIATVQRSCARVEISGPILKLLDDLIGVDGIHGPVAVARRTFLSQRRSQNSIPILKNLDSSL